MCTQCIGNTSPEGTVAASVRAAPGTEVETGEKGVVEEALAGMEVVTVVEEVKTGAVGQGEVEMGRET